MDTLCSRPVMAIQPVLSCQPGASCGEQAYVSPKEADVLAQLRRLKVRSRALRRHAASVAGIHAGDGMREQDGVALARIRQSARRLCHALARANRRKQQRLGHLSPEPAA